jgi:hypothetical protein
MHLMQQTANRRAMIIVLVLHLLLLFALLRWRVPALPALPGEARGTLVTVRLPRPPVKKIPEPATAGIKLAKRPSVGLPTARTIERQLATTPKFDLAPQPTHAAVPDPLPNLASIDVAASTVGTGGTGSSGAGAGSVGSGAGGTGGPGKLFEDCADAPGRPMAADVYRLPPRTDSLAALNGRQPIKHVCLSQLDIAPRSFNQGFPGLGSLVEWFGLDIRFTVNIAEAGTWEMALVSDDGAILSIDDVDVIDNDGVHGPRARLARVRLPAGIRHFRVRYFQGPRQDIALVLVWKRPGERDFEYIPASLLGRPAMAVQ